MAECVIWVDDDRSLIEPEIFDLEVKGFQAQHFDLPSSALDWIERNSPMALAARLVLIDALLPRCHDQRFRSDIGMPAGLILCERLQELAIWDELSPKVRLYTRLPDGRRLTEIKTAAEKMGLRVFRKSTTSRIALWALNPDDADEESEY